MQAALEELELDIAVKKTVINIERLPVVIGYQRQLQQLFQNFISNAVKYCKEDVPPHIDIFSKEVIDEETAFHQIPVKDNGISFPVEYSDKILKMFIRLHRKDEYSGTGVGLSIVNKNVESHNGFIRFESTPGEVATFNSYLPVD